MNASSGKIILGLVDASPPGGVSEGGSGAKWELVVLLAAWRPVGEPVAAEKLRCLMPVSKESLSTWMDRIQPYDLIEAELQEPVAGGVARLKRIVAVGVADAELAEVAAVLRGPIRLFHPDLGTLEYDRQYDLFSGRSVWCGEIVEVSLSGDPDAPEAVAAAASRLFNNQAEWDRRIRDFAVERLLPLKNDVWLGEGEAELSREDFLARMTLESIDVDEAGVFAFWHSDGDLFGGHSIQITGHLDSGPTAADIPG